MNGFRTPNGLAGKMLAAGVAWCVGLLAAGCDRPPWAPGGDNAGKENPKPAPATAPSDPLPVYLPMTEAQASAFVRQHKTLFQGWRDANRRAAADKALGIAGQFKGTDTGAEALVLAAEANAGACEGTKPLGPDGWDRAIALYQRVIDEYPGTRHAKAARWRIAGCCGCWDRWGCCRFNQGKEDWAKAVELYRRLYQEAADPGSKCDALRRIAEIQCNCTGDWHEGLATYRRILAEFPQPPPQSPCPTCRTCGPLNGTHLLDFDIVEFTHARLMERAASPEDAIRTRDEFARLAPQRDTIRFHTLYQLQLALRRLGATKLADEIQAKIALCDAWLVVGPFNGTEPPGGDSAAQDAPVPTQLSGLPRLVAVWKKHLSGAMRVRIRTAYAPEADCLAGRIDPGKVYRVSGPDGREGKGAWIGPPGPLLHRTWDAAGALYALTYVHSPKDQRARLRMAVSGFARAYLNGKSVLATDVLDYPVMDQHVGGIELKAGRNELLIKIVPWDKGFRSYVRVTGELGWSLPGVTYSAPPEPPGNRAKCDFLHGSGGGATTAPKGTQ